MALPSTVLDRAGLIAHVKAQAAALHLDWLAAIAVASQEGLGGTVGDSGLAFGPWQWHLKEFPQRLIDAGRPDLIGASNETLNAWTWSTEGINAALSKIAEVAGGLTGHAAISAIVTKFERPRADLVQKEIDGAVRFYTESSGAAPPPAGGPPPSGGTTPPPATGTEGPSSCTAPSKPLVVFPSYAVGLEGISEATPSNLGEYIGYWLCKAQYWAIRLGWAFAALVIIGVGLTIYALDNKAPGVEGTKKIAGIAPSLPKSKPSPKSAPAAAAPAAPAKAKETKNPDPGPSRGRKSLVYQGEA